MGKLQSKHECFFVSADTNKALDSSMWKGKAGFNLTNYNMDDALSELSICLQEESVRSPLRVDFPPHRLDSEASKMLKLDPVGMGNHGNKEGRDKNKLNIEEFECGLQFESSDNAKQEWSFTLYDFDGNGKITKEDLASLLKALYDAVGSSIKLPPDGAKTLKLRLSVGQENTPHLQRMSNPKCPDRSKNTNKTSKNKVREFSKMNNLTRTQVKCTNEKQEHPAALTNRSSAPNQNQDLNVKGQMSHPAALTNQSSATKQNQDLKVKGQMSHLAVNQLSAKNQQELANLVQENMERNQIRQLRRHQSDSRKEAHHHKRRHRATGTHCPVTTVCAALSATMTAVIAESRFDTAAAAGWNSRTEDEPQDDRAKESQDRRNYYLDLAGVENKTSKFQNKPTVPVAGSGFVRTAGSHYRSRSHDVSVTVKCDNSPVTDTKCDNSPVTDIKCDNSPVRDAKCDIQSVVKCDNTRREFEQLCHRSSPDNFDLQYPRTKAFDPEELPGQTRSPKSPHPGTRSADVGTSTKFRPFRPISLPLTVSAHHHRRHRHRERDHSVAMQQVAQWIEREHARDLNEEREVVQRHEHHHIHEHHHHHHYHHYYEA